MKKKDNGKIKKVIFHKTYMGKLGTYIKDTIYVLPYELYQMLKIDCSEISEEA